MVKLGGLILRYDSDFLSEIYNQGDSGGFDSLFLTLDSITIGAADFSLTDPEGFALYPPDELSFVNDTVLFKYSKVEEINSGVIPSGYELSQNYPNPFNPETKIEFALPGRSHVTLNVYNTLGQKVATLVDEELEAGWKSVTWDGRDDGGNSVATGVYLYRLEAGNTVIKKKMMLLK
jgi:hypothetical protein